MNTGHPLRQNIDIANIDRLNSAIVYQSGAFGFNSSQILGVFSAGAALKMYAVCFYKCLSKWLISGFASMSVVFIFSSIRNLTAQKGLSLIIVLPKYFVIRKIHINIKK